MPPSRARRGVSQISSRNCIMEPNIYLNPQERGLIAETLLDELKSQSLSKYAQATMMAIVQKLNAVEE